jgi:hypothetical protein
MTTSYRFSRELLIPVTDFYASLVDAAAPPPTPMREQSCPISFADKEIRIHGPPV